MIRPTITEKSLIKAREGRFTFSVPVEFTKGQIKDSIQLLFEVVVAKVWTVKKSREVYINKARRRKVKPSRKSAVLTLKKGSFDFFDSTSSQATKSNKIEEKGGKK